MTRVLICLLMILISTWSTGQDKIQLMNGQLINCKILNDSALVIQFEVQKKSGKIKSKEIHRSEVFSYTLAGQAENILYSRDELIGDIYSVEEMRAYMAGEIDARENFTAWPTGIVGFAVCGTAAYMGGDGLLTTVLPPVAYACLQFIPRIKIRESTMKDTGYKFNDIYADGYEPPARSRKIQSALKGGAAGAAAGLLTFLMIN